MCRDTRERSLSTLSEPSAVAAWLLMSVHDGGDHGGNAGYDDQPDVYYTWDSTVAHHARIKAGDPIAIWDKDRLLGVSVIEEIVEHETEKSLFKCPRCSKARIRARKNKKPRFHCSKCQYEFEKPTIVTKAVTEYRSRHDAAWTSLEGVLTGHELRQLCVAPESIQSMRPLRWNGFEESLRERGVERAVSRVAVRAPDVFFPQGHSLETVRVRRGQKQFRAHLLENQAETCAFTGPAPARVLEAGHLYSYAKLGVHREHGGLLLRRDIHRLFDDGSLAVDPDRLRVDVADHLEPYSQYTYLHGARLQTDLRDTQVKWLAAHWAEHRAS